MKNTLKTGMRVKTREKEMYFVVENEVICNSQGWHIHLNNYNDNLLHSSHKTDDIMEIYDIPVDLGSFIDLRDYGKLLFKRNEEELKFIEKLPEVGRKVRIFNVVDDCWEVKDKIGVVVPNDTPINDGMPCGNEMVNDFLLFFSDLNQVWRIGGDWKYVD